MRFVREDKSDRGGMICCVQQRFVEAKASVGLFSAQRTVCAVFSDNRLLLCACICLVVYM